jgi:Holliday junction resolvasome RuvABC endonuclease subunit
MTELRYDYRMMAIDPSARSGLGIAIGEVTNGQLVPVYADTIDLLKLSIKQVGDDSFQSRLKCLDRLIYNLIDRWDVRIVACEDCYLGASAHSYRLAVTVIERIRWIVKDLLPTELKLMEPSVVKVYSKVHGNDGDKNKMSAFVEQWTSTLPHCSLDTSALDEHSTDALAILHACHRRLLE